jgi:hypothetical protein
LNRLGFNEKKVEGGMMRKGMVIGLRRDGR